MLFPPVSNGVSVRHGASHAVDVSPAPPCLELLQLHFSFTLRVPAESLLQMSSYTLNTPSSSLPTALLQPSCRQLANARLVKPPPASVHHTPGTSGSTRSMSIQPLQAAGHHFPRFCPVNTLTTMLVRSIHELLTSREACQSPCRQLGIVRFEPLRPFFLDVFQAAQAALPTLPHAEALAVALDRNWSSDDSTKPPTCPALVSGRPQLQDLPS